MYTHGAATGRVNHRRRMSETGLELLAGVSDIFHVGMFLFECTGTSGTIFEYQSSFVWIISISRFKNGNIVWRLAEQSIIGTSIRLANISSYGD